jgi:Flp pilus assembly protein TadG
MPRLTRVPTPAATARRTRARSGQSLVEFALILVPIMLLLLGAIQFGVIWAAQVGVTNAVRDAVRAASGLQPKADAAGNVTAGSEATFATSIYDNVLVPGLQNHVPFYNATAATGKSICYSTFTDVASGTALRATATVTYGHPIFIPLLSAILGPSISTTTTMSIPVGLEQPYVLPGVGTSAGVGGC